MIDFTDLTWLDAIILFAALLGLMVWFSVRYWRKGRERRTVHRDQR
jgi:hypothetical protein